MGQVSIRELESVLDSEADVEIVILPNGEIRAKGSRQIEDLGGKKPLTFREDLGGEY